MNKIPVVISEKKRISKISDKILSLYQELENYFINENVDFPSKASQRIILYFIYQCMCLKNKKSGQKFKMSDVLDEKTRSTYLGITKPIEDYNLLEDIYSEVLKIVSERDFEQIVYYVLEVFEYVDIAKDDKKKNMGIYYTPDDVVKYMVDTTITTYLDRRKYDIKNAQEKAEILNQLKIADLACGTGIFLVYAVRFILPYYIKLNFSPVDAISEILSKNIWGIDISEKAVETAKILLLLDNRDNINDFWELYRKVSFNIKQGNSIADETLKTIEMIFPELYENTKFTCIVGNPPYSYSNGQQENLKEYVSYTNSNSDKMYLYFIENMIRLSDRDSVSSMIIPLAIAYNTSLPFRKIRNYISEDNAHWKFAFFDRSPDSIFGDDVKTRISIIFRESSNEGHQIHTTELIRWNSQNRDKLFENIKFSKVENKEIEQYIFKTGNIEAEKAHSILRNYKQTFISNRQSGDEIIYYYPTAYNWLSFFLQEPLRKDKEGTLLSSNAKSIHITDDKNLVYALLCSTITYWLWIGTGDIFHVSTTFIESLPYNTEIIQGEKRKELIMLGKQLWEKVQDYKVYSNNAGIITMNFAYVCCFDIIDRINHIIANIYDLSDNFVEFLKEWYLDLVCAGRSEFKYQEILTTFKENKNMLNENVDLLTINDEANSEQLKNKELTPKQKSIVTKEEWKEWTKTVWSIANVSDEIHPAVFPIEIPYRLIRMYSFWGEKVLDTFSGMATTGKAALKAEREYIGFETNRTYFELSQARLRDYAVSENITNYDEYIRIFNSSCVDMNEIEDNSIGVIVTSPPYWNKADYGNFEGNLGGFEFYDDFLDNMESVIQESYRVLMPGRKLCIVTANVNQNTMEHGLVTIPIASDLTKIGQKVGFALINQIIWNKDGTGGRWGSANGQRPIFGSYPYPPNFLFKNVNEYIIILQKPDPKKKNSKAPSYSELFRNKPR